MVGLVYVAAYALQEGESLGQLQGGFPDPDLAANLVYAPCTLPDGTDDSDVSVRIDAFPAVVAAGVDEATALVLAVSQRPLSALAHGEVATEEAWASQAGLGPRRGRGPRDQPRRPTLRLPPRRRAPRRRGRRGSHLVMHQNPQAVVDLIIDALDDLRA